MKLTEIMEATGFGKGYCSTIRAGTLSPHVSTGPSLARLVGLEVGAFAGPNGHWACAQGGEMVGKWRTGRERTRLADVEFEAGWAGARCRAGR